MDADGITHVERFRCPRCGYQMDALATSTGEHAAPSVGDINACMACGLPMVFIDPFGTGVLRTRPMTDAEVEALSEEQRRELARIRLFAENVMRPRGAKLN